MMPANHSGASARNACLSTGPATLPGLLHAGVARNTASAPAASSGFLDQFHRAVAAVKAEPIWLIAACIAAGCALVMAAGEAITAAVETPPALAGVHGRQRAAGPEADGEGVPITDPRSARLSERERVGGAVSIPQITQSQYFNPGDKRK